MPKAICEGFCSEGNEKGNGKQVDKKKRAYEEVAIGGGRVCEQLSKERTGGRAAVRASTFKQPVKPRFLHGCKCL